MRIEVVTLFPQMFEALTDYGVTGRAIERQLLTLGFWNPRDYAKDKHRTVDDRPYGGGPGMVMMVPPLREAIRDARAVAGEGCSVIYLSPQGKRFDQAAACRMAEQKSLVLVSGRYEGIDERIIEQEVDEEWSIGDYVLSGGELASMVIIDTVSRLIPGVLGHEDSAAQDSFMEGLLDHPHYTRPEILDGIEVPEVLLSGDHKAIARWRMKQALGRTWIRRPDLLENLALDREQQELLQEFIHEYETR
jgi:tRNA (guanine37-N1)-methyltransferase